MRYVLLAVLGLVVLALALFFTGAAPYFDRQANTHVAPPPYAVPAAAQRLHDALLVADLHNDLLLWDRDPLERGSYGNTDVPRLAEGGVGLQVFSVVTKSPWGQNYERNPSDSDRIGLLVAAQRWPVRTWGSLKERALYQAQRLRRAAARSDRLVFITSRRDLEAFLDRRTREPNLLGALLAMEGLHPLEGDFGNLDVFIDAGYRMLGLTHFFDNEVAGSAHGMEQGGLTELGRRVVERMQAHGIVIDLAHTAPRTVAEVLALATQPVVVSHGGVQGTCPGPRNLTDDQLRGVAATGGVVGIGFWDGAVCEASVDAIVRAIRYAVGIVGVDHVALGSDFDGSVRTPFDATGFPLLTEALLADGFSEGEVAQIMGGNVLRVLRTTLPD